VGVGLNLRFRDSIEEVIDFKDVTELRRLSVFDFGGTGMGGIKDLIACLGTAILPFPCSSTGIREETILSLGLAGAFPSICNKMELWSRFGGRSGEAETDEADKK
jgi:hypothetical protein